MKATNSQRAQEITAIMLDAEMRDRARLQSAPDRAIAPRRLALLKRALYARDVDYASKYHNT